jgi:hypothetical protein
MVWVSTLGIWISTLEGMQPKNHFLSIVDARGNAVRAQVLYLQPKGERSQPEQAVIHVQATGRFTLGTYRVTYEAPGQTISGYFHFTTGQDNWYSGTGEIVMKGTFVAKQPEREVGQ